MKEHGLGTPATRAQIIENLVGVRYLNRQGKELQPTSKAMQTIGLLKNVAPELVSPELTGEWEFKLREIEHKQLSRDQFMKEIRDLTAHIVKERRISCPMNRSRASSHSARARSAASHFRNGLKALSAERRLRFCDLENRGRAYVQPCRSRDAGQRPQDRAARWIPEQGEQTI